MAADSKSTLARSPRIDHRGSSTFGGGLIRNRINKYSSSGSSSCSTSNRASIRNRNNKCFDRGSSSCSTANRASIRNWNNEYSSSGSSNCGTSNRASKRNWNNEYSSSGSSNCGTSNRASIRNRNNYSSLENRWQSRSPAKHIKYGLSTAHKAQQNRNRHRMNRFGNDSSPRFMTWQHLARMKKERSGFNHTEKPHTINIHGSTHQTKSTISSISMTYQPLTRMKNKQRGFNGTEKPQTISQSSYPQSKSSLSKKSTRASSKTGLKKSSTQIHVQENKLVSNCNRNTAAEKCVTGKILPDVIVQSHPIPSGAIGGRIDPIVDDDVMYHLDNTYSMSEANFSDNYMHKLYEEAHLCLRNDDNTSETSEKLSIEECRQIGGLCPKLNEASNAGEEKNISKVVRPIKAVIKTTSVHVKDQWSFGGSSDIEFSDTFNVKTTTSNHDHESKTPAFRQKFSEPGNNAILLDNMPKRLHAAPKDCTRKRSRFIADHEDTTCSGSSPKRNRYETTMMPNGNLTHSQLQRLRNRRAEIEETFTGDCNNICEVVKMLVRKNPSHKSQLLDSLEADLDDKRIQFFSKFEDIMREIISDDTRW